MSKSAICDAILTDLGDQLEKPNNDDVFELLCGNQATKEFNLSWDQLEDNIVDGGDDGGVDAVYVFAGDNLVTEIEELDEIQIHKNQHIHILIIQSKNSTKVKEIYFSRICNTIEDLLGIDIDLGRVKSSYNDAVIEAFRKINVLYKKAVAKSPIMDVRIILAYKGEETVFKHKIEFDIKKTIDHVKQKVYNANVEFEVWNAQRIIDQHSEPSISHKQISFCETPTSTDSFSGVVGFVSLTDWQRFLDDGNGVLDEQIFDSQVRSFEGEVLVNRAIMKTLSDNSPIDFWWLNNGVTIICSKIQPTSAKTFQIDTAQIVNGQQTSTVIWNHYLQKEAHQGDQRRILVKLIQIDSDEVRGQIVHATNFQ